MAVQLTLKLEACLPPEPGMGIAQVFGQEGDCVKSNEVAGISSKCQDLLQAILDRLENLETEVKSVRSREAQNFAGRKGSYQGGQRSKSRGPIICYKCGAEGHIARECRADVSRSGKTQGNENPSMQRVRH